MTDKLIVTDGTSSGLSAGAAISDTDYLELQQSVVSPASTVNNQFSAVKTWIKSWIAKADVGLGNVSNNAQLTIANNLSDLNSAATARDNLGGIFPINDPDFNDSAVYLTSSTVSAAAGAGVANQLSMTPIWVPRTRLYTTYAVIVTVLSASTSIRLGLYNSNSALQPTTKIDEATTTIDTSTGTGSTGLKTVAFGTNQTLKPGLYFLASLSDGAPTMVRLANNSNAGLGMRFTSSAAVANGGKFRSGVAYTTLPADESAQTYTSQASAVTGLPLVGIR